MSEPSISYTFTIRIRIPNRVGMLSRVIGVISEQGASMNAVDLVRSDRREMLRDLTVMARSEEHAAAVVKAVRKLQPSGIRVVHVSDRVFLLHLGGKIAIRSKIPVDTRDALSLAYTPGVARVARWIAEDPARAYAFTMKGNSVAIVTDGSAVLGLGNIGPEAALPVMEGKAMLFKEFADVDAFPICLATQKTDEIVRTVRAIAPGFGGINLEDISAPRCFEVEGQLRKALDVPVFHDDQHGTAIVVMAALINALRVVRRRLASVRIVVSGAGAAGMACVRMMLDEGARRIVACDRQGVIHPGRKGLTPAKRWLAAHTNPEHVRGTLEDALRRANVFLGLSAPGVLSVDAVRSMARDPVVFALANPDPEIQPEDAEPHVRIMATGRSDYPNQINNVLAFPGVFRGALDARATDITDRMKTAAAHAIADCVNPSELNEEYIVPSVFRKDVFRAVSKAVAAAARADGVARKTR